MCPIEYHCFCVLVDLLCSFSAEMNLKDVSFSKKNGTNQLPARHLSTRKAFDNQRIQKPGNDVR